MLGKSRVCALALALFPLLACSAGTDEGVDGPAEGPDTEVLDSCLEFASRLCADAEVCCRQRYDAFEQAGCVETFRRDVCRPGADAVAAGKATFDGAAVEACLEAHAEAHQVCVPSWAETLELRRRIYEACRVIDGTSKPGSGCSISATCKRPGGAATAECVKNVCVAIEILPEGAACQFPSGSVSVCDRGLTCSAAGPGDEGECVPAIAEGEPCNGDVLEGTECGLGSYCDSETATCRPTTNMGGAGCEQSTECVSFECDRLGNDCAPAPAVVSLDTCVGPSR